MKKVLSGIARFLFLIFLTIAIGIGIVNIIGNSQIEKEPIGNYCVKSDGLNSYEFEVYEIRNHFTVIDGFSIDYIMPDGYYLEDDGKGMVAKKDKNGAILQTWSDAYVAKVEDSD